MILQVLEDGEFSWFNLSPTMTYILIIIIASVLLIICVLAIVLIIHQVNKKADKNSLIDEVNKKKD